MQPKNDLSRTSYAGFGLLGLSLVALSLSGCINYGYPGSGLIKTEIRDVPPFAVLGVHDNIEFSFTESKERLRHDVKVMVDDNLARFVTTQVNNGRLDVRVSQALASRQLRLEVLGPALQGFVVSTRAKGTVSNLSNLSRVSFELSTGGQLTVAQMMADTVNAQLTTGSVLTIEGGSSGIFNLNLANNSKLNAENFRAGRVEATLNSQANARVQATTAINARLTDNSSLFYKGSPQINQQVLNGNSRLLPISE